MKVIHPNLGIVALLSALVWLIGAAGCRTPQGQTVNPFLAPDRVPPPATRALLPGQAQPYYPGDPLPVMQSAAPKAPASQSTSMAGLAWTAPEQSARNSNGPPGSSGLAFSNEPTVAIPSDNSDLRFALPGEREQEPQPTVAVAAQPQQLQPVQLAGASTTHAVAPASYNEPVLKSAVPRTDAFPQNIDEPLASGPWRAPQIPSATGHRAYGTPPIALGVAAISPQATMNVRLRAVPSPPPEPVDSRAPRIRLPGYAAPQPWSGAAMPLPTNGVILQTVPTGPPPPPYASTLSVASAATPVFAGDGFRPRSSMR